MGSVSLLSILTIGFVLGLKHALDADHLAAISTMATQKRSLAGSSLIGALWGLGHTISLLVAGVIVIVLHVEIGQRTSKALEFCVGVMLIVLGVNALRQIAHARRVHIHVHEHEGHWHAHPHIHGRKHEDEPHTHHGFQFGARPLFIGMVHGVAGSAALMLLVLAAIPSPVAGLLYIGIFGIGSIAGMTIMSTLFVLPSRLISKRFARADLLLRGAAGLFSLGFGIFMIWQIGFVDRLLM
jgi:sulfite exporter TauE/SafE